MRTNSRGRIDCVMAGCWPGAIDWTPQRPTLYRIRLSIRSVSGALFDEVVISTGFRTLSIGEGRLCLNGIPIFLKGFNRHDDSPKTGLAMDLMTTEADLRHMRDLGANCVRLCHYPHHSAELDLCDQLGLMVMAEIPLYWWKGEDADEILKQASDQLQSLIRRDRHHSSVVSWSVSNETHEEQPAVRAVNRALIRQAQALDPTRWAVHVSNCWREDRGDFAADDMICVNHYPSLTGFLKDPGYSPVESRQGWTRDLALLADRYPGKPVVVAEFGYIAWAGVSEGLLAESHQAQVIEAEFLGITAVPAVCGAVIWCYADHPWPEEDFLNRVTLSPYGVVTRDRREKAACRSIRPLFQAPDPPRQPPGADDQRSVIMIRPDLLNIPDVPFVGGFGIRAMTLTDAGLWEDIERDAEPFFKVEPGLFLREFGSDPQAIPRRCFLITAPNGCAVGTISAWYNRDFRGRDYGRIHWVAIRPAFQGKGLAKAGLAHALTTMAQWHDCAYLVTSTGRVGAIQLYLKFGFQLTDDPA